jgi:hypothetical protein
MSTQTPNRAVPFEEACRICNFSVAKGYEEVRAGRLIARKCGRQTLVLQSDLNTYLESLPALDLDNNGCAPTCRNMAPGGRKARKKSTEPEAVA